jgi:transposase
MTGRDIIVMSMREIRRLKAVQSAIDGHITQKTVAAMLGLSERQVRRVVREVRERGDKGVMHGLRGRPSNRKIPDETRAVAVSLYQSRYPDFGPTLATEKLRERDGVQISDETLRRWLIDAGLWKKGRKRSCYRQWRPRKECFGQMVQMDGSHHEWLEGRGPRLVLMAYIDDATNTSYGRFYEYEGTIPAMDSFRGYVRKYGLPMSVYLDRHTTYKSPRKPAAWDEAASLSQFERALKELGVEVIHALSPQAKGRIERLFGVLQDRLVKEMRLAGITTREGANAFLAKYLPRYNKRFGVCPANETDVHVALPVQVDLNRYLCIKRERTIRNDHTIALDGRLYQLEERGGAKVVVEERLDGSLHMISGGVSLKYRAITERPEKKVVPATDSRVFNRPPKPANNHPWKKSWKNWMPAHQQKVSAY